MLFNARAGMHGVVIARIVLQREGMSGGLSGVGGGTGFTPLSTDQMVN